MALLQISEPGEATAPHQHRLAVGIDLGTTNSLVATVRSGQADTLADEQNRHLLPSVVQYQKEKLPIVGLEAKQQLVSDPENTISSVKRLIGRSISEIKGLGGSLPYLFESTTDSAVPRIKTSSSSVSAIEVSSEILKSLKSRAEQTLGGELNGVVITVPAYFDDAQRQATKDAGKIAGLNVLRLLNEPTAAAVAYGLDKKEDGIIVIYDFGGGTFDVSILRLNKGVFEVLATAGDTVLGGDDFDHAIAEWLMEQAGVDNTIDNSTARYLLIKACDSKEKLTENESIVIELEYEQIKWSGELTRNKLHEIIDPLIKKTLLPCRRALRDADLNIEDINEIIMVGGSTRVPRVRNKVKKYFQSEPLADIDPDKVVAIGAAIQADVLVGNKSEDEILLLDITPLSLGLETMGELVEKVIPRNTVIPAARAQDFTTFKDGQTAMSIHVLQGERDLVTDCRSLGKFTLNGIPPMVAGAARIRVTFQVDADGLLSVSAREETTGVESAIEVKPSYGLMDSEVEQMLRDSLTHAEDDVSARMLREQQVEADRVIEAVNSALAEDADELLTNDELQQINNALTDLRTTKLGTDTRKIKAAIALLDKATSDFASRRMDKNINKALSGHKLDEFE
ncbi:Chaperone protein HscA [hydrothermal vent metagenome]|uniref:Chaperone protein HscA n=1 Tax=hydrothermal vent metagenome TaxID=652676 RepID=A0A3B1AG45_9ZZZZ